MREICTSGSMSGVWKQSHGRASEAPPDERGGYRYVRPTATAPHLDSTEPPRSVARREGPDSGPLVSWRLPRCRTRPSSWRTCPCSGDQPFAHGVEHQRVFWLEADADGFTDSMRGDRAGLEDPQITDVCVDDIKDLAPHRLHLGDPPADARAG